MNQTNKIPRGCRKGRHKWGMTGAICFRCGEISPGMKAEVLYWEERKEQNLCIAGIPGPQGGNRGCTCPEHAGKP